MKAGDLAYFLGPFRHHVGPGLPPGIVELVEFLPAGSKVMIGNDLLVTLVDGWLFTMEGVSDLHGAEVSRFIPLGHDPDAVEDRHLEELTV